MSTSDVWNEIGTLVCDLDGVVYLGDEGVAGSGDALASLAAAGIDLLYVTNNSTKTPAEVAAKIEATTGYAADAAAVVTSGVVTADRLSGIAKTALVVGGRAIDVALESVGIEVTDIWQEADAVVVGLDFGINYDKLAGATQALRNGALFYATNTDSTYPTPDGLLPGGGVMVGALAIASGLDPIVSGKPHASMVSYITQRAQSPILVVGDRPETDAALARAAGWSSAIVLTGVTRTLDEIPAQFAPDVVVTSLADLAALRA